MLMDAYCAGDPAAFNELFKRLERPLYGYLRRMTDETRAHDLVQKTFLKVHQYRDRYKPGASSKAWIYTIARNNALDYLRSAPKRREWADDTIDEKVGNTKATRDIFENQRLWSRIEELPDGQRQVIELHFFHELNFSEIAKVLNIKSSAARVRAHRAYKVLKVALEKEDNITREEK